MQIDAQRRGRANDMSDDDWCSALDGRCVYPWYHYGWHFAWSKFPSQSVPVGPTKEGKQ